MESGARPAAVRPSSGRLLRRLASALAGRAFPPIARELKGHAVIVCSRAETRQQGREVRLRLDGRGGVLVQETGLRNRGYGADKFGFEDLSAVHWNLTAPVL